MAPLQFGILMIPYQTLDAIGPLDILSSCSKTLINSYEHEAKLPAFTGLTAKAIDIEFHHINTTLEPVKLTANVHMAPTTTIDTCPPLDILLVGGPDPLTFKLSEPFAQFLQQHVAAGKILFTTCTGALAVAPSGVLDGKNATVNHGILDMAPMLAPNVKWQKKQWVRDGNIWTAGGACAGMDMVAHWVMENYGMDVASAGFTTLDYEPRDVEGERVPLKQLGEAAA